jgi:alkylation response protein AidB-like acyl-CoA dehydrogenase
MVLLNFTRINIAAQALGIAQRAFEKAMEYALQREAFGKKIYQFEGLSFKISEMFTRIQASRLLTYWAANISEEQFKHPEKALPEVALAGSAAKIFATETAEYCAREAVQIHGGSGVDFETGIERYLRDSVITTIYEGTNEIQRYIIARFLPRIVYGTKVKIG